MNGSKPAPRAARGRWSALLFAMCLAITAVGVPAAAWGLWQASAVPASRTIQFGTVTAPGQPTCTTTGSFLSGYSAVVSWPAVARVSAYDVTVRNASGTTSGTRRVTPPTTTVTVTTDLLSGLVGGLLQLLLGGTPLYVTVQAVDPSGWVSAPSPAVRVGSAVPGIQCVTG